MIIGNPLFDAPPDPWDTPPDPWEWDAKKKKKTWKMPNQWIKKMPTICFSQMEIELINNNKI